MDFFDRLKRELEPKYVSSSEYRDYTIVEWSDGTHSVTIGIRRTQADYIQRLASSDFRCTHNVI